MTNIKKIEFNTYLGERLSFNWFPDVGHNGAIYLKTTESFRSLFLEKLPEKIEGQEVNTVMYFPDQESALKIQENEKKQVILSPANCSIKIVSFFQLLQKENSLLKQKEFGIVRFYFESKKEKICEVILTYLDNAKIYKIDAADYPYTADYNVPKGGIICY